MKKLSPSTSDAVVEAVVKQGGESVPEAPFVVPCAEQSEDADAEPSSRQPGGRPGQVTSPR